MDWSKAISVRSDSSYSYTFHDIKLDQGNVYTLETSLLGFHLRSFSIDSAELKFQKYLSYLNIGKLLDDESITTICKPSIVVNSTTVTLITDSATRLLFIHLSTDLKEIISVNLMKNESVSCFDDGLKYHKSPESSLITAIWRRSNNFKIFEFGDLSIDGWLKTPVFSLQNFTLSSKIPTAVYRDQEDVRYAIYSDRAKSPYLYLAIALFGLSSVNTQMIYKPGISYELITIFSLRGVRYNLTSVDVLVLVLGSTTNTVFRFFTQDSREFMFEYASNVVFVSKTSLQEHQFFLVCQQSADWAWVRFNLSNLDQITSSVVFIAHSDNGHVVGLQLGYKTLLVCLNVVTPFEFGSYPRNASLEIGRYIMVYTDYISPHSTKTLSFSKPTQTSLIPRVPADSLYQSVILVSGIISALLAAIVLAVLVYYRQRWYSQKSHEVNEKEARDYRKKSSMTLVANTIQVTDTSKSSL